MVAKWSVIAAFPHIPIPLSGLGITTQEKLPPNIGFSSSSSILPNLQQDGMRNISEKRKIKTKNRNTENCLARFSLPLPTIATHSARVAGSAAEKSNIAHCYLSAPCACRMREEKKREKKEEEKTPTQTRGSTIALPLLSSSQQQRGEGAASSRCMSRCLGE